MDVDGLAKIIWEYHHLNQPLKKADFIFVLGGHDLRVPEYAAGLFLQEYAPRIGVSGGVAHQGDLLKAAWEASEAEMFSDVLEKAGIPRSEILTEDKAHNTGENFSLMQTVLEQEGFNPETVIVVTKPYMERRAFATGKRHWPSRELIVTSPQIPYEAYVAGNIPKEAIINIMIGDLQRIKLYGENGFQIPQEIPGSVWSAYEQLVEMGYTKHLSRG